MPLVVISLWSCLKLPHMVTLRCVSKTTISLSVLPCRDVKARFKVHQIDPVVSLLGMFGVWARNVGNKDRN